MFSAFSVLVVLYVNILLLFQNKAIAVEQLKTSYFFCVSDAFLAYELIRPVKCGILKQIRGWETTDMVIPTVTPN